MVTCYCLLIGKYHNFCQWWVYIGFKITAFEKVYLPNGQFTGSKFYHRVEQPCQGVIAHLCGITTNTGGATTCVVHSSVKFVAMRSIPQTGLVTEVSWYCTRVIRALCIVLAVSRLYGWYSWLCNQSFHSEEMIWCQFPCTLLPGSFVSAPVFRKNYRSYD